MVTTCTHITGTHSLKKKETEERSIEYHQTKMTDRNTKGKYQWRHRAKTKY